MSIEDYPVSFSLEVNVERAYENILRIQTVVYRTIDLLHRIGLPENIDDAITKVQRLITVLNSLRLAILALEAASGPIGWLLAGIGIVASAFMAYDYAMELRSH